MAELHAVGADRGRDVDPIVDEEHRARVASRGAQALGEGEERSPVEILVAELQGRQAGAE